MPVVVLLDVRIVLPTTLLERRLVFLKMGAVIPGGGGYMRKLVQFEREAEEMDGNALWSEKSNNNHKRRYHANQDALNLQPGEAGQRPQHNV